jgi:hypothetical protein
VQGPLALFAMGDRFVPLTRPQLLSLTQTAPGTAEWSLDGDVGCLLFYPWTAVGTEPTRLYQFLI